MAETRSAEGSNDRLSIALDALSKTIAGQSKLLTDQSKLLSNLIKGQEDAKEERKKDREREEEQRREDREREEEQRRKDREREEEQRRKDREREEEQRRKDREREEEQRREDREREEEERRKTREHEIYISNILATQGVILAQAARHLGLEINDAGINQEQQGFKTPSKQIGTSAYAFCTPYTGSDRVRGSRNNHYSTLSKRYKAMLHGDSIEFILPLLGEDWRREGVPAVRGKNEAINRDADAILNAFWEAASERSFGDSNLEACYQDILVLLVELVQAHLPHTIDSHQLYFADSHATSLDEKSKPDLLFMADFGLGAVWRNIVACAEVKSERHTQNDGILYGQLLHRFILMNKDQPRRAMLGLGIAKGRSVRLYVCTPSVVVFNELGELPDPSSPGSKSDKVAAVVRFLILMHKLLPRDYGFIVHKPLGIFDRFRLSDIIGLDLCDVDERYISAEFRATGKAPIGGRHEKLFGENSWAFNAMMKLEDRAMPVILKFHWYCPPHSERDFYKSLVAFGAPHIPQQFLGARVDTVDEGGMGGEFIVVENAGVRIDSYFERPSFSVDTAIGLFAAYTHTLLVAATGDGSSFMLHRDISIGNLMVRGNTPFVIDWGCALLNFSGNEREISQKSMVGTAIFMALRVLADAKTRSIIDDLDSLFLVATYCTWIKYGDTRSESFKKIWSRLDSFKDIVNTRKPWLSSEKSFFKEMSLKYCPVKLRRFLAEMRELLYPASISIDRIEDSESDPRIAQFDPRDWANLFKGIVESKYAKDLETFVVNNPCCADPHRLHKQQRLQQQSEHQIQPLEPSRDSPPLVLPQPKKHKRLDSFDLQGHDPVIETPTRKSRGRGRGRGRGRAGSGGMITRSSKRKHHNQDGE